MNPVNELASTVQATHVEPNPDPRHDLAPATAASGKQPVRLEPNPAHPLNDPSQGTHPSDIDDELPTHILRPVPRAQHLPPLPDMRFEQSYLARIANCTSPWSVAWTTILDQALMPLTQGFVWNLALFGWRAWNTGARFHGKGVGARLRRWWWEVNNWTLPEESKVGKPSQFGSGKRR